MVIVPLLMQHFVMLERNLIYTAVTRGKKMVVLVGQMKALAMGVKNNKIRKRYTWLAKRLALDEHALREDMLPFAMDKKEERNQDVSDSYDDIEFLQPIDEEITFYDDYE